MGQSTDRSSSARCQSGYVRTRSSGADGIVGCAQCEREHDAYSDNGDSGDDDGGEETASEREDDAGRDVVKGDVTAVEEGVVWG